MHLAGLKFFLALLRAKWLILQYTAEHRDWQLILMIRHRIATFTMVAAATCIRAVGIFIAVSTAV